MSKFSDLAIELEEKHSRLVDSGFWDDSGRFLITYAADSVRIFDDNKTHDNAVLFYGRKAIAEIQAKTNGWRDALAIKAAWFGAYTFDA